MKIYFAADHAGFELKNALLAMVRDEMNMEVEDIGAHELDATDDYPIIVAVAARALARDIKEGRDARAILVGASGQGEAIVANRFEGVRAAVFYGQPPHRQTDASGHELDMIASIRMHNDTNALSLGARFISLEEAQAAVRTWLTTDFSREERHLRRIAEIDTTVQI